jgi:SAM-dependent methyltransferase
LSKLDLPDASLDRVACLAGLHHQVRKLDFFREAARILRPQGRLVVADVLDGSPPAQFLNIAVDRYTELGHNGVFLQPGEVSQWMSDVGLVDIHEEYIEFTWDLPSLPALVEFCHMLFRMDRATLPQVREEIDRYLTYNVSFEGAHLHWSLIYASGHSVRSR